MAHRERLGLPVLRAILALRGCRARSARLVLRGRMAHRERPGPPVLKAKSAPLAPPDPRGCRARLARPAPQGQSVPQGRPDRKAQPGRLALAAAE